MARVPESVARFLQGKRLAVAGVSRHADVAANAVFKKLRDCGYEVLPVNPNTDVVEGVKCYPSVVSIPGKSARLRKQLLASLARGMHSRIRLLLEVCDPFTVRRPCRVRAHAKAAFLGVRVVVEQIAGLPGRGIQNADTSSSGWGNEAERSSVGLPRLASYSICSIEES